MKKDILFIGATHGDETIGVKVLENLEKNRNDFDWIIGNPKAFELGEREYEGNLNRSAPGQLDSSNYALRRAAEIIKQSKEYRYTIDVHGTPKETDVFAIICNLNPENFRLASMLNVDRIVYWPSFSDELQGPLCEYFPCGLELECGPKDDPETQKKLESIINDFLNNQDVLEKQDWQAELSKRNVYEVYGSLKKPSENGLEDFVETEVEGEQFTPLLAGRYKNNGIYCYKMRQMDIDKI